MKSEQQFIDIYNEAREVIYNNSCREMNAVRD